MEAIYPCCGNTEGLGPFHTPAAAGVSIMAAAIRWPWVVGQRLSVRVGIPLSLRTGATGAPQRGRGLEDTPIGPWVSVCKRQLRKDHRVFRPRCRLDDAADASSTVSYMCTTRPSGLAVLPAPSHRPLYRGYRSPPWSLLRCQ